MSRQPSPREVRDLPRRPVGRPALPPEMRMQRVHLWLPPEMTAGLDAMAERLDVDRSAVIRDLLALGLKCGGK